MDNIIVSACCCGTACRYHGRFYPKHSRIKTLEKNHNIVPVCPEVLGGLPIPREAAYLKDGRVFTKSGKDVTDSFKAGAEAALKIALESGARKAYFLKNSPSCDKFGVAGALFDDNGILVINI